MAKFVKKIETKLMGDEYFMIRIGQAGIPLSCKGRTNKDGLVYTKQILDLNAMEIERFCKRKRYRITCSCSILY